MPAALNASSFALEIHNLFHLRQYPFQPHPQINCGSGSCCVGRSCRNYHDWGSGAFRGYDRPCGPRHHARRVSEIGIVKSRTPTETAIGTFANRSQPATENETQTVDDTRRSDYHGDHHHLHFHLHRQVISCHDRPGHHCRRQMGQGRTSRWRVGHGDRDGPGEGQGRLCVGEGRSRRG